MQKLFFKEMNRVKLYLDILRGKKEKTWFTIIRIRGLRCDGQNL